LIAALNDLEVLSADVGNAYLNASMKDWVHTICGPEFGPTLNGRISVITCALYGLKSSDAAWRNLFVGTLSNLGFWSSLVDPDVWLHCAENQMESSTMSIYLCMWMTYLFCPRSLIKYW
jgi:hypothetical protein